MTRENAIDLSSRQVSREERREALIADLRECGYDRLTALRFRAVDLIRSLKDTHAKQLANGMPVTDEMLRRKCARPELEIECIDEVLAK